MGAAGNHEMRQRCGRAAVLAVFVATVSGCSAPERRADFDSIDPSERSAAAAKAAAERDSAAVPDLIVMLDSADPAARMVAIAALDRITGERLGYDASANLASRRASVQRWVKYAVDNGYAASARPMGAEPIVVEDTEGE